MFNNVELFTDIQIKHWKNEWEYAGMSFTIPKKCYILLKAIAFYYDYYPEDFGITTKNLDQITNTSTDFYNY